MNSTGIVETSDLITLRRHLHANPELRFTETATSRLLQAAVEPFADEVLGGVAGTGLIATLWGAEEGANVLVRADIDAYPVQDAKQVAYRSGNPGVAHACGHDVHASVAVGLIRRLAAQRPERGSVTVVFQPAEEIPFGTTSGAAAVLSSGALDGRAYAAVLGLHCWPQLAAGSIGVESSVSMAAKDAFEVRIEGASSHAATPAAGRDAILAASSIVCALHAGLARRRDPHELVAFNVGTITGGTSQSALASEVTLTGTLRTHDGEVRRRLRGVIEAVVAGTAQQCDLTASLTWANEMPAVVNDADLVALARELLPDVADVADLDPGPMTTDDFALYRALAPTLYLKLGVCHPDAEPGPPLHSALFDVDERCIEVGVRAIARLCSHLLTSEPGRNR